MPSDTIDQRVLRPAHGVAVPPHLATERHVLAEPIPACGGNPNFHDHHLHTREDHIPASDKLDRPNRSWVVLRYASMLAMLVLFLVLIARS